MKQLTKRSIDALKPGQSVQGEGLTVERTAGGDLRYKATTTINGMRLSRALGFASEGFGLADARAALDALRAKARASNLQLPEGRKTGLQFSELAIIYMERGAAEGLKNMDAKGQHLRDHLTPFFGAMQVSSIDKSAFARYRVQRLGSKVKNRDRLVSAATVNRELATLRHVLNTAAQDWLIIPGHKLHAKAEKEDAVTKRGALAPAQVSALLDAAQADSDPDVFAFALLAVRSAMRMSEVLALRVRDVDLDGLTAAVHQAKAGSRYALITRDVADHLRQRIALMSLAPGDWLFPNKRSKEGRRMSMASVWPRIVARAGLSNLAHKVVRHTLRHSAATQLARQGLDLPTLKMVTGHKSNAAALAYIHEAARDVAREAMERAAEASQARVT